MKIGRRNFIGTTGMAFSAIAVKADEKITDGGLAAVSLPGKPKRKRKIVPPGSKSHANLEMKCVGCQLCVQACPSHVLRAGKNLQVEMGFEHGYCRIECTRCSEVCPTGAIVKITAEQKKNIHLGHAVWKSDLCLASKEGVSCTVCERHCPVDAIKLLAKDEKSTVKIPKLDKQKCIGCGACENLCPARPMPAIFVSGYIKHREVVKQSASVAIEEAESLIDSGKAAAVLVKDDMIVASENGRGVAPLLRLYDTKPEHFMDSTLVDKVIGRAAASIAVAGGAKCVYASIMSEGAEKFLLSHGVKAVAKVMTAEIENRTKTGICPFENAVKDIDDVDAMLSAIRDLSAKLNSNAPKSK